MPEILIDPFLHQTAWGEIIILGLGPLSPPDLSLQPNVWLKSGGTITSHPEEAITLSFRARTERDRIAITRRAHELAGGLAAFVDLQQGVDSVRAALRAHYTATLWPDGKPEVGPAGALDQEAQLREAWQRGAASLTSDVPTVPAVIRQHHLALTELLNMLQRIEALAEWPVLIEDGAEHGWHDLADNTAIPPAVSEVAIELYLRGREQANAGNGLPSTR